MNGDESIEVASYPPGYVYTPPHWPPPSGGAPFSGTEMGPILNPYPYGTTQGANISTQPPNPVAGWPPPWGSLPATAYPQKMPIAANGQNQGPSNALPPTTKPWEGGPQAANPFYSQIYPAPIMGPGPQGTAPYEQGPLAGTPPPTKTFPAGSYIDGYGNVITPTYVVTLGMT